jgi:tetratricopeptide repeat protein 21B
VFWKSYGIFKEGAVTEAIRELEYVKDRREISYAAHMALIYYHDHCRIPDRDAIDTLKFAAETAEGQASDKDLMHAAMFFLHVEKLKRASQTIQKVLDSNPNNLNAVAVKGWIYLNAPKEDYVDKALEIFESVLNEENGGSHKHLDALLGRAAYFEKKKNYQTAIEIITEIQINYREFLPA